MWKHTSKSEVSEKTFHNLKNQQADLDSRQFSIVKEELFQAAKRVLETIKFGLQQEHIEEQLLTTKSYFWSEDKAKWNEFFNEWSAVLCPINRPFLNMQIQKTVQDYIENKYKPFLL